MQGQRYRQTAQLNKRQVSACFQGAGLSEELEHPLNTYVVLDFRHTDISLTSVSHVFETIRSGHFVRWFARRKTGLAPMFIWTIEAKAGSAHVNWLVHIPLNLVEEFTLKLPRWFKRASGEGHISPAAIDIQPIGAEAVYSNGVNPLVRYVCKGIDPFQAKRMYIKPVDQGVTYGKRCGVSRSLGKAAIKRRRAAGFAKPTSSWRAKPLNPTLNTHPAKEPAASRMMLPERNSFGRPKNKIQPGNTSNTTSKGNPLII